MIRVYCVGIHFDQTFDFAPDMTGPDGTAYMSGGAILAFCATKYGLRYKLSTTPPAVVPGHINYVSYTPTPHFDPQPRVTFPITPPRVFPFYGLPLSLTEILAPIGQVSQVLQYTVQSLDPSLPAPQPLIMTGQANDGKSSFGTNGFQDGSEIRIRSLNIYCTY